MSKFTVCPLLTRKRELEIELITAQERVSQIQQEIEIINEKLEKKEYAEQIRSAAYFANFGECVPVLVSKHFDQNYIDDQVADIYNVKYAIIDVNVTCKGSHSVDCKHNEPSTVLQIEWDTFQITDVDFREHLALPITDEKIKSFCKKNLDQIDKMSAVDNWNYKVSEVASGIWYGKQSIVIFYQ